MGETKQRLVKMTKGIMGQNENPITQFQTKFNKLEIGFKRSPIFNSLELQRLRSGSRNDTFSVQGIGSTLMAPGQIVKQLQGIIHLDKIMYEMLRSYCHTKRPNDSTEMVSLACSSLSGMASSTDVNIDHGIPLSEELQWINELNLPKHQYEWYLDLRRHGTVKNSGFSFVFDLLVLYATGLNDVRDVVPFPRSFAKANY
ncbi:hypothetical protein AgCh_018665 [Apium graveolens]